MLAIRGVVRATKPSKKPAAAVAKQGNEAWEEEDWAPVAESVHEGAEGQRKKKRKKRQAELKPPRFIDG